jgi:hypothetical protein
MHKFQQSCVNYFRKSPMIKLKHAAHPYHCNGNKFAFYQHLFRKINFLK